ncbi:MAG: hypothetical protein Q7K40_02080 [bacterium]|nr:hypothetical protein [bacterium]
MELNESKMDELLELTRENNKILKGMRSSVRWGSFFRFVYWAAIIGATIGVYYHFQPTIQKYAKTLQTSVGIIQNFEKAAGTIPTNIQSTKGFLGR